MRAEQPDHGVLRGGQRGVRPVARCAVVALTAGLLVGGDLGAARAVEFGGVGGAFARSVVERSTAAQTARLAGAALQAARAQRTESLAVADAALAAAVAVGPLTPGLADAALRRELAAATERLSDLRVVAAPPAPRQRADVPVPVARSARPADPPQGAELTRALRDTAGDVFRLAMRVETLSGATMQDETVTRVASAAGLEQAVVATGAVLDEVGELRPLTPLTDEEKAERAAQAAEAAGDGASAATTTAAGPRPRLRAGTPAAVVALMERWENGRIPVDVLCPVEFAPDHELQCDAAAALADLNVAYRERWGTDLALVSSYRELETQVRLRATKGGLAAVPGTSNHGWGIAVDFGGIGGLGEFDRPGYLWLKEHAAAFGWFHPAAMEPGGVGPEEPWHWEYGTTR